MNIQPSALLVWIPLLPLLGALVNGLLGLRVFRNGPAVPIVACGVMAAAAVLGWVQFFALMNAGHGVVLRQVVFEWIHVGSFEADFALWFDPLAAVMVLIITNVGFLIHLYSVGYMGHDPGLYRFFAYLNLFVFAMLCLVLGDNLAVLFLGWEGVGLCSYLLIGFWFEDKNNAIAGKKAFIFNRVGDLGFLLGMFLLFVTFGSIRPEVINGALAGGLPAGVDVGLLNAAALLLFLGATGKSAQIPLHAWLPDAMAGPTPVSALIHAATMVTAGVYMIARMNGVYFHAEVASSVVLHVGAATAFFAATVGLVQNDIKKVLAYSTVSQLGFMFAAMGSGAYAVGVFHLMTHAFFKACLFLGSGSVIIAMHHNQDMRHYGGLKQYMPVTHLTFLIATLAISGVPFFAGFYSKDEILWWSAASERGSWLAWTLLTLAAFCTAFYMFRILWLTFWGKYRGVPQEWVDAHGHHADDDHGHHADDDHGHAHKYDAKTWRPKESPWTVTVPLVVLGLASVVGGWLGLTKVTSFSLTETNLLHDWLHPVFASSQVELQAAMHHDLGVEFGMMGASILVAFAAIGLSVVLYRTKPTLPGALARRFASLHTLLMDKYRVDEAYEAAIIKPIENGSRAVLWKFVDVLIIDGFVHGVADTTRGLAQRLSRIQTGDTQRYVLWMVTGLVLVALLFLTLGGTP